MKTSSMLALGVVAIGLSLVIAGPLLPGGERVTRLDLPSRSHVTELAQGPDGAILAGTQDGEIWRLLRGQWTPVAMALGGQPVTALAAEPVAMPTQAPVGTAAGLVNPPPGMPPLSMRISDEVQTDKGLVVGTDDGLWMQGAGAWVHALPGVSVYRLARQPIDAGAYVHAGTIGAGVYSARDGDGSMDWQPNRNGLPDGAYVFSFAMTPGGRLLAGTDQGLYWQPAPLRPWQRLQTGLEKSRILSLQLPAAAADAGNRRLWIGSDKGLYLVDLTEDAGGIEADAYARPIEAPPDYIRYGISWIVPYDDGVLFSAGSVYRYGPAGVPGWYWVSIAGVLVILIGGWLFPGRERGAPNRANA